ncbi:hypothetical protein NOI87_33945, partial [Neorhizobium galegae]|nr:hypothetical protein [Neorhizobium galegae]
IVLVFLYMISVIFILGAEFNAALMKYRIYSVFNRFRRERRQRGEALSKAKEATDIPEAKTLVAKRREPG